MINYGARASPALVIEIYLSLLLLVFGKFAVNHVVATAGRSGRRLCPARLAGARIRLLIHRRASAPFCTDWRVRLGLQVPCCRFPESPSTRPLSLRLRSSRPREPCHPSRAGSSRRIHHRVGIVACIPCVSDLLPWRTSPRPSPSRHLGIRTRRGRDANAPAAARGLIGSRHLHDAVRIDVEGHFDLRHAAWGRRNPIEDELAQRLIRPPSGARLA